MPSPEVYETIGDEMSPDELLTTRNDALVGFMPYQRDNKTFRRLIDVIPIEHQQEYFDRLKGQLAHKNMNEGRASFYGMIAELRTIEAVLNDGLETVNFSISQHLGSVAYRSYGVGADLNTTPDQKVKSPIDLDVPIERDGKAYVYETKSSFRKRFGESREHRNQCLKYQAAIKAGKAAGASVQIKGLVDSAFLEWANRDGEEATIPDVELLYTLDLPSGIPYTALLKEGAEGNGLRYANQVAVRRNDTTIVRNVEQAVKDGVYGDIIALVSAEMGPPVDRTNDKMRREKNQIFKEMLYQTLSDYSQGRTNITSSLRKKTAE